MASLTVRNLDDRLKARLRVRAARHGRSMEEEARAILRGALGSDEDTEQSRSFAEQVGSLFAPLGGLDIQLPARDSAREPPDFS